jgi:hypothetical protein
VNIVLRVVLFETFREHNAETVFSSMKTIMVHVLEESENISLDILSPLLDCLNKKNEVAISKFNVIIFNRLLN